MQTISRFWKDQSGATAIEYGLIVSLIGIAVMISINVLGGTMSGNFSYLNTTIR
ncbi:MAG: Flp family type IVb pilin [Xanthobacteraceae bacterium]|nr:Flp family type IVb pilin [Xanthobacteraceae bacterium]